MKASHVLMFVLLAINYAAGAASVQVTMLADNDTLLPGETTTVHVYAQVVNPASTTDGISTYDVNVDFDQAGIIAVHQHPVAFSQLNSTGYIPNPSKGTPHAFGLDVIYGAVPTVDGGVGSPLHLFNFDVIAIAPGTVTLSVSGDNTIGIDFLLLESFPPPPDGFADYYTSIEQITVTGEEVPEPVTIATGCVIGLLALARRQPRRHSA